MSQFGRRFIHVINVGMYKTYFLFRKERGDL